MCGALLIAWQREGKRVWDSVSGGVFPYISTSVREEEGVAV